MWHLLFVIIALYICIEFPTILLMVAIIVGIWAIIVWGQEKPRSIKEESESIDEKSKPVEEKESIDKENHIKTEKQSEKTSKDLPPECEFVFEDENAYHFDIPE